MVDIKVTENKKMKKQLTLHKMAKILLLLNFTFLTLMCFGQNYKAQFDNLCLKILLTF